MATLNQIFDEIKYGKEYLKNKVIKEEIKNCYDANFDIFYASKRIKQLSGNVVMEASEEMKVNRLVSKLSLLEERIEDGRLMSDAYRKIQTASVMDDCKAIVEEVTQPRKVDSRKLETFAKIITATKYFIENNIDDKVALKESSNPLFNKMMKEEKALIEEVL